MLQIYDYPRSAWDADRQAQERGQPRPCPCCKQDTRHKAHHILPSEDTPKERRYRMCKACGFYQCVDGDPIRLVFTQHSCRDLAHGEQCDRCKTWGPRSQHPCLRAVRRDEFGTEIAKCDVCKRSLSPEDEIPWPVPCDLTP